MTAFDRLHPRLQHAIVHDLNWRSLRPVQEEAVAAILDGDNAVVLAPTAGGKTEASMFPVLSLLLNAEATSEEAVERLGALYVCPIRALLNNQEERLQHYARMVGLRAFKWHGDVAASAKRRFEVEPASVLMITPESIEVMMMSTKTDARALFAHLQCVVIDEVHAFAGDDRGAHLVSLLERLNGFCGHDLQRIGLSATVGNPEEIGRWLQGSSQRPFRLVDPPKPTPERDLHVDLLDDMTAIARDAAHVAAGKKCLVFVESRRQAESVAGTMTTLAAAGGGPASNIEVFVHHSAVSRGDREHAEAQFKGGKNTAIVCTSTMELGIDVGDLDQVLQVDAPSSVASLLQRMGRTGRRPGTRANCRFFCQKPETLLQVTALLYLMERGWVEDVGPVHAAAHVLAHQVMALSLQDGGISRHRVMDQVGRADAFADLEEDDVVELIDTMLARRILHETGGLLSLGDEGEKRYGRRNFFELYAVFSAPPVMRVTYRRSDVGTIQSNFLRTAMDEEGGLCFRLAGRSWQVTQVDWDRGQVQVKPADQGRVPNWLGTPGWLARDVCQEMKRVLADDRLPPWLSESSRRELTWLRGSYEGLVTEGEAPFELVGGTCQWHTFAGGAINQLLAAALESLGLGRWTAGNLSLKSRRTDLSTAELGEATAQLPSVSWYELAATSIASSSRWTVSKFQPCLPDRLATKLLVERLTDVVGAEAFVAEHSWPVLSVA